MVKRKPQLKKIKRYGILFVGSLVGLLTTTPSDKVEGAGLGGPTHIGTFEGSTTFTTSSSNGINPGLFIEVMDEYGNLTQYESEEGIITVPNTKEGAYVTQAKLLGKTKYRDRDTGELLENWEEGRNLALESVQMPVLTTTGKNTLNPNEITLDSSSHVNPESYTYSEGVYTFKNSRSNNQMRFTITKQNASDKILYEVLEVKDLNGNVTPHQITMEGSNDKAYWFSIIRPDWGNVGEVKIKLGVDSLEPYKSNILTTPSDLELRGIGEVKDELNLLTGEVTGRIGEIVLDGSDDEIWTYDSKYNVFVFEGLKYTNNYLSTHILDKILWNGTERFALIPSNYGITSNSEGREYLSNHPITLQYKLESESVKTVFLDSTYYFQPVMNRDVYVDGTILPLVCSVTIPTETLSFVLNPNAETGQQFVAPEFTVVNHTPTSIYLELKRFEQLTTVMNDVLPEAHEDWSQLNREQSKDIALALVPQPSEGWLNLEEGPRYVAEDSNYYLGEVKAESSVDFTFIASHGRAFVEPIDPKYRLSFVFDFR